MICYAQNVDIVHAPHPKVKSCNRHCFNHIFASTLFKKAAGFDRLYVGSCYAYIYVFNPHFLRQNVNNMFSRTLLKIVDLFSCCGITDYTCLCFFYLDIANIILEFRSFLTITCYNYTIWL